MKIIILLSTYNGAKFLKEQLDSIYNMDNIKDISILARDDGSNDGTQDILESYAQEKDNFSWFQGENLRPAKSFWELLFKAPEADYYSFADQDDVWDKDKLSVAINKLKDLDQSKPALYVSDVRTVDGELNPISNTMVEKDVPIDYPHSLIKNICPGCTYVFNKATRLKALKYDPIKYNIDIHDWVIYKIANLFGTVVFDDTPHMSYRQHGHNTIGANKTGLAKIIDKIKKGNDPQYINLRQKNALAMLDCYGDEMSEENYRITNMLAHYVDDKKLKKAILKEKAFKTSGVQYLYFKHRVRIGKF